MKLHPKTDPASKKHSAYFCCDPKAFGLKLIGPFLSEFVS